MTPEEALALLAWQVELGADEAVGDAPVDRFAAAEEAAAKREPTPAAAPAVAVAPADRAAEDAAHARAVAAACGDLEALRAALSAFDRCALKRGASSTVFADGLPGAHVMLIGEAPGREEDRVGRPFVGRSGKLLDRMLAAIGLSRTAEDPAKAVYITNVSPWRPLENRNPSEDEAAMLLPFVERHVELAAPKLLVLLGNTPSKALLATTQGVTRTRGRWAEWRGLPALPMYHPAYLLRQTPLKRMAWQDLLTLQERLERIG